MEDAGNLQLQPVLPHLRLQSHVSAGSRAEPRKHDRLGRQRSRGVQ